MKRIETVPGQNQIFLSEITEPWWLELPIARTHFDTRQSLRVRPSEVLLYVKVKILKSKSRLCKAVFFRYTVKKKTIRQMLDFRFV